MCFLLLAGLIFAGCRTTGTSDTATPRERARAHLSKQEPAEAISLLEPLWRASPEDLSLARELASAYVRAGRGEELLQKVAESASAPAHVAAYIRGLVRFTRASEAESALKDFEEAVRLKPGEGELHHRLGLARVEAEQYEHALPSLRRALELNPRLTSSYLPMAKALHRTGQPDAAVAALRQWLAAGPEPRDVPGAKALMESISDPYAGIPQAAEQRLEQGLFWLEKADVPQEALASFEDILREYPDLALVHALTGLCHQRLDDAGRALESFKRAIELSPRHGRFHFYVGELYLSRQRAEPAREAFERAVELNPLLVVAYERLGQLSLRRSDLSAAASVYEKWVALEPERSAPKLELALVYQLQGRLSDAERLLVGVAKREPQSLEAKLRLGLLYVEMHQKATTSNDKSRAENEARRLLEEVLEAQPENALASRALQSLGSP